MCTDSISALIPFLLFFFLMPFLFFEMTIDCCLYMAQLVKIMSCFCSMNVFPPSVSPFHIIQAVHINRHSECVLICTVPVYQNKKQRHDEDKYFVVGGRIKRLSVYTAGSTLLLSWLIYYLFFLNHY